mgnify:CR=1 FL=1
MDKKISPGFVELASRKPNHHYGIRAAKSLEDAQARFVPNDFLPGSSYTQGMQGASHVHGASKYASAPHQSPQAGAFSPQAQQKKAMPVQPAQYQHVILEGDWSGRTLTSWAESYPVGLAKAIASCLQVETVVNEVAAAQDQPIDVSNLLALGSRGKSS